MNLFTPYGRALKVIDSCKTPDQAMVARKYASLALKRYTKSYRYKIMQKNLNDHLAKKFEEFRE